MKNKCIPRMEYYSALWNADACYSMGTLRRYYVKWNKSDAKWHILYDSTYMRFLEQRNSLREKE